MPNTARFLLDHPLTRRSKLKALLRFSAWQVKSRLEDEIITDWVGGTRLAARQGMTGAIGNIYAGLHEFPDMLFALHFLRPGDLFLDIGANVGSYTVLAAGARGAKTLAFEPNPAAVPYLQRNIELNGIRNLTTVYNVAIGAEDANVPFLIGRGTTNRVANPGEQNVRRVRQQRLDDILENEAPTMIKMDVEGYEDEVLKGSRLTLRSNSLLAIAAETSSGYFQETLSAHGYRKMHYNPYARSLVSAPTEYPHSNALFIRDEKLVAERLRDAPHVRVLGHDI